MANELRHEDTATGTTLQRTDWEDVDNHRFDSQAIGDLAYASSLTQISRLGITNDRILISTGGIPAWSATLPAITLSGTVSGANQTFDAGAGTLRISSTSTTPFEMQSTQDGTFGVVIKSYAISTTPANNDRIFGLWAYGEDDASVQRTYGRLYFRIEDVQTATYSGKLAIHLAFNTADNEALTLSAPGALWVDQDIDFSTSLDSALVADHVSLGCFDIGGLRALAISQENPAVNAAAGASDWYLPVRVNGVTFKLLLHS